MTPETLAKSNQSEHSLNKKHRGARNELAATVWLLNQGYEVFRNVSFHGKVDLIAYNPENGELIFIDVKSASFYIDKSNEIVYRPKEWNDDKIKLLVVSQDGQCWWNEKDQLLCDQKKLRKVERRAYIKKRSLHGQP